jgi:hypothetical protein
MPSTTLTDREQRILDLEGKSFKYQGAKEIVIRDLFGNVTHYYQQLIHLLDRQDAIAYAPMTVGRLRGRRGSRR